MQYNVIVIGAGMVGTSIAWHLQKNGSQVLLLDKKVPGSETSYGNAGLIQREAIHAHAFPRQLSKLVQVLPNQRTDVRYSLSGVLRYSSALLQYWQYSSDKYLPQIEQEWSTLIKHCIDEHAVMVAETKAEHLIKKVGWIELHRCQNEFDAALNLAKNCPDPEIKYQALSVSELQAMEPNINVSELVGAIHWKNTWQVNNPGELVRVYAKHFEQLGGEVGKAEVQALQQTEKGWQVTVKDNSYLADHVVIATGAWSDKLIKPLGYELPLFPMRGYHLHFKQEDDNVIHHPLFDMHKGFVIGPMQQGLRVTTGAEFSLLDSEKRLNQLNKVLVYAKQIVGLNEAVEAEPWSGFRPCMPDMKPVIGAAYQHQNLWFAFGHAHHGLTLGPVTGRLIEEMIHGKTPFVPTAPFATNRFLSQ